MTDGELGPRDLDGSETKAPVVRRRLDAVEHDVADDVAEHERQTADEPLSAREVAATWSTTHREPDVLVVDTTDHTHTHTHAASQLTFTQRASHRVNIVVVNSGRQTSEIVCSRPSLGTWTAQWTRTKSTTSSSVTDVDLPVCSIKQTQRQQQRR